jgi:ribosomal protein L29
MKQNDITALHGKTLAQLQQQLEELEHDLASARLSMIVNKLEDVTKVPRLRKDIARITTVLSEKSQLKTVETIDIPDQKKTNK